MVCPASRLPIVNVISSTSAVLGSDGVAIRRSAVQHKSSTNTIRGTVIGTSDGEDNGNNIDWRSNYPCLIKGFVAPPIKKARSACGGGYRIISNAI